MGLIISENDIMDAFESHKRDPIESLKALKVQHLHGLFNRKTMRDVISVLDEHDYNVKAAEASFAAEQVNCARMIPFASL